jgi:hypothetical protein
MAQLLIDAGNTRLKYARLTGKRLGRAHVDWNHEPGACGAARAARPL